MYRIDDNQRQKNNNSGKQGMMGKMYNIFIIIFFLISSWGNIFL